MTAQRGVRQKFRHYVAIDERPALVALAQKKTGKLLIIALAVGLLLLPPVAKRLDTPLWSVVAVLVAAAHAYLPSCRAWVLFISAWVTSLFWLPRDSSWNYLVLGMTFTVCWLSIIYARGFKSHFFARRPVVSLLTGLFLVTGSSALMPPGTIKEVSWTFVTVFSVFIWYLCYAIVDQRSKNPNPVLVQLGVQQPFWLTSSTPVGKGAAFIRKHLSATPQELAVTQLKAIKLLIWMVLLILIQSAIYRVFVDYLGIPSQQHAISAYLAGSPYPRWVNWLSVTLDTVYFSIFIAVYGHQAIGIARLAGFRLPRNTCRPLESRTLAEFWNRYNFYFKEVMVDFFYIPTFLKAPKKYPRLRMFIATFMAAGTGNFVFHFIRDLGEIHTHGMMELTRSYLSYALYCSVLATGIGLSQLRLHAGIKPGESIGARAWSFVVVWGFIVILQNFDINMRMFSVEDNLRFTASLFWPL